MALAALITTQCLAFSQLERTIFRAGVEILLGHDPRRIDQAMNLGPIPGAKRQGMTAAVATYVWSQATPAVSSPSRML